MNRPAFAFISSETRDAEAARQRLTARYGDVSAQEADVIVALGGDGLMLQVLHDTLSLNKPIFGMNMGSIGFLMNDYEEDNLRERIERADMTAIHPLRMHAMDKHGQRHEALAINEVALLRETRQSAKISIFIDGLVRMPEIICDGIMVATPAGSTAYNLSAHGPVLPIDSNLLALTPISAFRPRRWRGALLDHRAQVRLEILESDKRPVSAVADHTEVRQVVSVEVSQRNDIAIRMLFDRDRSLQERVLVEQFSQ